MANFTVNVAGSFVNGTAASDTFDIFRHRMHGIGTGWRRRIQRAGASDGFTFSTAVPATTASISASNTSENFVFGGDGNDAVFIAQAAGTSYPAAPAIIRSVLIRRYQPRQRNVLDGGDGDDFVGATANSNWLLGGIGNDNLQAVGDSNALIGGDGNDQFQANGNSNTLDGGTGNDSLFIAGGASNNAFGGTGNDWLGANGSNHVLSGGDGIDWIGATGNQGGLFGERWG